MQSTLRALLVALLLALAACNNATSFSTSHTDSAPGGQVSEKPTGKGDRPTEGDEPVPGYLLTSPQMTASADARSGNVRLSGPMRSYVQQQSGAQLTAWRVLNTLGSSLGATVYGDGGGIKMNALFLGTVPVRADGSFDFEVQFGGAGAFIALATDARPNDNAIYIASSHATTVAFKDPYQTGPLTGVRYVFPSTGGIDYATTTDPSSAVGTAYPTPAPAEPTLGSTAEATSGTIN